MAESEDGTHGSRSAIKVIDLAAAEVRLVYAGPSPLHRVIKPRWSPDGSSLVFEQDTFKDNRLDARHLGGRRGDASAAETLRRALRGRR